MRITIACPEALIPAANTLAMTLAFSEADSLTFRATDWCDASGNRYAACSFEAAPGWVERALELLVRPAWDLDDLVDIEAAGVAQSALVVWQPNIEGDQPPPARPMAISVVLGLDGLSALSALGLAR